MELTPKGLENWERVVETVATYIEVLRKSSPEESIYKEVVMINEINFGFKK
jgi:secreted Zn-dependent insulinase-like peptidase